MPSLSDIQGSEVLGPQEALKNAMNSPEIRFCKISFRLKEQRGSAELFHELSVTDSGDPQKDVDALNLDEDVPAYILARLDNTESKWLEVHYIPTTAHVWLKVRSFMQIINFSVLTTLVSIWRGL